MDFLSVYVLSRLCVNAQAEKKKKVLVSWKRYKVLDYIGNDLLPVLI